MRISHKTVQEQMDAARRMEATDQALILCKQQQDRIATLEADNARLVGEVEKWKHDAAQVLKEALTRGGNVNALRSDLQRHKDALVAAQGLLRETKPRQPYDKNWDEWRKRRDSLLTTIKEMLGGPHDH